MKNKTVYVPFEKTVKEYRAATDESIRLLNEMQQRAEENIIKKIEINGNDLRAVALAYHFSPMDNNYVFDCKFILNSKEYFFREKIDKRDLRVRNVESEEFAKEYVKELVCNNLSILIAKELVSNIFL
jgi:hypothetical protein